MNFHFAINMYMSDSRADGSAQTIKTGLVHNSPAAQELMGLRLAASVGEASTFLPEKVSETWWLFDLLIEVKIDQIN